MGIAPLLENPRSKLTSHVSPDSQYSAGTFSFAEYVPPPPPPPPTLDAYRDGTKRPNVMDVPVDDEGWEMR